MEIYYREKAFTPGKKSGKMTLPPQKKKKNPVTPLVTLGEVAVKMQNWKGYLYLTENQLSRNEMW